jgi:hypothetical protein
MSSLLPRLKNWRSPLTKLVVGMRLLSCTLWGIGGVVALPAAPLLGTLSIVSAALFFGAIVLENR